HGGTCRAAERRSNARDPARHARGQWVGRLERRAGGAIARGRVPRCRGSRRWDGDRMRGALAVAIKELRQIRRDRRTLVILVVVPTFFLFLYGYALNFDIRHIRTAVEDRDNSSESRRLIAAFAESTYFDIVASATDRATTDAL